MILSHKEANREVRGKYFLSLGVEQERDWSQRSSLVIKLLLMNCVVICLQPCCEHCSQRQQQHNHADGPFHACCTKEGDEKQNKVGESGMREHGGHDAVRYWWDRGVYWHM